MENSDEKQKRTQKKIVSKPVDEKKIKKQAKKEELDKKRNFNRLIDEELSKNAVNIVKLGKGVKSLIASLDEFVVFAENQKFFFDGQTRVLRKIEAMKRLIGAIKNGINRTKPKIFDIDQGSVRNKVANSLGDKK